MWQPAFFALLVVLILFSLLAASLLSYRPAGLRVPLLASASMLRLGIRGGTAMLSILIGSDLLAKGINDYIGGPWLAACRAMLPTNPAQLTWFSVAMRALVTGLLVLAVPGKVRSMRPRWVAQYEARNALYGSTTS